MSKLRLGVYCAAGCGGCDIAILEIHEHLVDLLAVADVVFWPCATDFKYADVEAMPDASIDICLFNGAIRNEENARIARLLRAKSAALVAFGSCAAFGGIPGLGNLYSRTALLDRAFTTESTDIDAEARPAAGTEPVPNREIELPAIEPTVRPLASVVRVDYVMPGCPPSEERVWEVCTALAAGELPAAPAIIGAGGKSVCEECSLEKRGTRVHRFARPHEIVPDGVTCLMEQGLVCAGPATRSGCGARCTSASMPCRGCYGPAGDARDQGAKLIAAIGSLVDSEDEGTISDAVAEVVDPAGTFYRFSLPTSLLGRAKPKTPVPTASAEGGE